MVSTMLNGMPSSKKIVFYDMFCCLDIHIIEGVGRFVIGLSFCLRDLYKLVGYVFAAVFIRMPAETDLLQLFVSQRVDILKGNHALASEKLLRVEELPVLELPKKLFFEEAVAFLADAVR